MTKNTDELTVDFEHLYEQPCPNCGEHLDWEWDSENVKFVTTCTCFEEYQLTPHHGEVENI